MRWKASVHGSAETREKDGEHRVNTVENDENGKNTMEQKKATRKTRKKY
jgi:hypothetical protein